MEASSSKNSESMNLSTSSLDLDTMFLNDCSICCKARRTFYCKTCINNGNYYKSTAPCSERFAEKRIRLLNLKKKKKDVQMQCEKLLAPTLLKTKLINDINEHKERIRLMKCIIQQSKEEIAKKKGLIAQLRFENDKSENHLPVYKDKVNRLRDFVVHFNRDVAMRRQKLEEVQLELKKVSRTKIHELVKYIFPISVVQPSRSIGPSSDSCTSFGVSSSTSSSSSELLSPLNSQDSSGMVSALNEAATTAYMAGRWVTTDTSDQLHHRIVNPTLPASGDYSSYNDWVSASKDGVPTNTESVDQNQAYNISAALTYTTQLVNVIAFYLGIKLPNKLCYSELCSTTLSESKFARRVARLNLNVLHLCLSQNVLPELLQPTQTLQNILHLLDCPDLGRVGPVEVDPLVARALEDQLRVNLDTSSDDSGSDDDSDHLPLEWEAVPHVSCVDVSPNPHTPIHSHPTSASVMGGVVNSAAASLASFWRGWTTNR